jgi:hypothetical protein
VPASDSTATPSARPVLTDRDRAILAFESRWAAHTGAKEEAIRLELELAPARYYQLLNRLIDTEAALAHEPMLVGRLRRIRDDRRRGSRSGRIAG